ncbi:MAG: hypothetical protein IJ746_05985 [Ruminococcus sp.]|nr:hypothetical protein [Ruminococcus sp.]
MLKKITAVIAAAVMSLSLAACGSTDESSEQDKGVKIVTGSTTKTAPADNGDKADSKDPLAPKEQEPEEEQVTVKEYLMGGAWCYTDESFADLRETMKTREAGDFFEEYYWENTWFREDGDGWSPFCMVESLHDYFSYRLDDEVENEIYEAEKEYDLKLGFGFMGVNATLSDGRITFDRVEYSYSNDGCRVDTKDPITLVRKETITQEEFEKDFPGRYRLVQNDYIFGEMDKGDQESYDNFYGVNDLVVRDDRTAVWEPEGKTMEVKYLGDKNVNNNAVVGNLYINYLYMEHETFLYARVAGIDTSIILEKIG